ncbi:MAG: hypothetical protein JRE64_12210 [Deltaproteobacteria bacterium]|nr:hypothetical protein [Deltaproteobacteria bacterium]
MKAILFIHKPKAIREDRTIPAHCLAVSVCGTMHAARTAGARKEDVDL